MGAAAPVPGVSRARVLAVRDGERREREDRLAREEPMEVRVQGGEGPAESVAVTMRTPGHDLELAAGLLRTEGILPGPDRVASVAYCGGVGADAARNVVTVRVRGPLTRPPRRILAGSGCGVCGKTTLDDVEVAARPLGAGPEVAGATLLRLPEAMRAAQAGFAASGGLHAAALFTAGGRMVVLREDVGRHNAVDKVVGWAVLGGEPLGERVLVVSGRLGFEIVQKAAVAGIPVVCAVSAPSDLAVRAAVRLGVTAVAFLRDGGFNVYAHPERIA